MNNRNNTSTDKMILSVLIYTFIIFIGFNSYSFAEPFQKTKDLKANSSNAENQTEKKNPTLSEQATGYEVYIDPKTGKFLNPPKDTDTSTSRGEPETNSLETQQDDESIVELPAIGGGVMIEKPDGFLHDSTATIDAEGKLHLNCSEHDENHD